MGRRGNGMRGGNKTKETQRTKDTANFAGRKEFKPQQKIQKHSHSRSTPQLRRWSCAMAHTGILEGGGGGKRNEEY